MRLKPLMISTLLLTVYGLMFMGYYYRTGSRVYLAFSLFALTLAYGTGRKTKIAVKVTLIFAGLEFLMALFYLISGALVYAVDAAMSFFIIHDIMSYIGEVYKEEKEKASE
ncbi:hypothetical protein [Thermococcus peptonophilus]|uniref:Uncharacterized protein n=1 Tax=Thermococcus peptonophilus TaxID=53952 RepID=A0A142CU62_9EURY|nr:hypothetical protein [Thermococcus peptonophilus]AMQ18314.1 hypothetical protein A0127_03570 [Thermococcus peptonophilus]